MDIYQSLRAEVIAIAHEILGADIDTKNVTVEPPKDKAHGDLSSNAAMVLAKAAGRKPRELAEEIANKAQGIDIVNNIDVAGPGFLNFFMTPSSIQSVVADVLKQGEKFGSNNLGKGRRVNVEYVSANPTGPLHAGHMRGAVVGDALAGLLSAAGYDVTREYYVNDGGAQVDVLARSVYLRYLEAHGRDVEFPEGTYPGEYVVELGQAMKAEFGDKFVDADENEWLELFREKGTSAMMKLIESDLASLGVNMDTYYSERSLYEGGKIEAAIGFLDKQGLIYEGTLPPPKGKELEDWEARIQTLFKSTEHGDDVDRPIKKADGAWTYFAPDIAYHFDKIERGYDELIDVLGADHGGYVKRMQAAVRALSVGKVELDVKLCQLVKLFKNGEPFKMSKRAGNFVLLSDIIEEVGPDVARFVVLMRKPDAPLDFDFDKVKEQSKDNPVFYVQYAHARAVSIATKAREEFGDIDLGDADLSLLTTAGELDLIKNLANYPRLIAAAAEAHEAHRVAFYLYDLASDFHALQHQGKLDDSLRFIMASDRELSKARLALVRSVRQVVANGLQILGVSPMDNMR